MTGTREDTASAPDPHGGEVGGRPDDPTDRSAAWARVAGVVMRVGAGTPEELETLFEDALVMRDVQALAELFEEGAVARRGR